MRNTFGCLLARRATLAALAAALAAAGMGVAGSPTLAVAKSDEAVTYVDETGAAHELAAGSYTDISDRSFGDKVGYGLTDGWYVVRSSRDFEHRLTVTGDAKLVLCDGATANFTDGIRGYSGKLTVYGQSTGDNMGKLVATASSGEAAGIGGNNDEDNKTEIVICGGNIEATGDDFGAGIGGGDHGGCGTIRICGGNVTATGGDTTWPSLDIGGGAGIGSGDAAKSGGTVEISGGIVNAKSGLEAAGIGSGGNAKAVVDVTISGGKVSARGISQSAGIGGGEYVLGKVTITGGDITARSAGGASIGGGAFASSDIVISGGTIDAAYYYEGAGIGGGNRASGGSIKIYDGNISLHGLTQGLRETGGAGIGGGAGGNSGSIYIAGGIIESDGIEGLFAGGIGHGAMGKNETISIPDDYMITNTKTKERLLRDERAKGFEWNNLRLEPCDHSETRYAQTAEGHRLICSHCLARLSEEEPHEFGKDGACVICGYHADGPTVGAELGETNGNTATLRFWVAPNSLGEKWLEDAYVDIRVDGAYEVDGSCERCKRVDLADAERGDHGEAYAECRVVTGTEEDSPVALALHYGGDQMMVYETTLSELRKS